MIRLYENIDFTARCALFEDSGVDSWVDTEGSGYMKMMILLKRCALFEASGVDSGVYSG